MITIAKTELKNKQLKPSRVINLPFDFLSTVYSICSTDSGQLYHGEKKINVNENRRGNQEWTIQIHWQHWKYKTQDEDKQNTTQKTKKMSNTDPTKSRGLVHVLTRLEYMSNAMDVLLEAGTV
jgi:hypothetical protein